MRLPTDFQRIEPAKRVRERILDEVLGVDQTAGGARQTPGGPAPESWQIPGNQLVQGRFITVASPKKEVD